MKTILAAMISLVLASSFAAADPTPLTAEEIRTLLSGNAAVGAWNGTPYRQYFDPDGSTVYLAEGGAPDPGKWRVEPSTNKFESWWGPGGWTPYEVSSDGDAYFWVTGSGSMQGFVVELGDTLP